MTINVKTLDNYGTGDQLSPLDADKLEKDLIRAANKARLVAAATQVVTDNKLITELSAALEKAKKDTMEAFDVLCEEIEDKWPECDVESVCEDLEYNGVKGTPFKAAFNRYCKLSLAWDVALGALSDAKNSYRSADETLRSMSNMLH